MISAYHDYYVGYLFEQYCREQCEEVLIRSGNIARRDNQAGAFSVVIIKVPPSLDTTLPEMMLLFSSILFNRPLF
jgi:hypothetical protein